jgi:hypothetical protein
MAGMAERTRARRGDLRSAGVAFLLGGTVALAAAAFAGPSPAPVPLAAEPEPAHMPLAGRGAWREHVQPVWNAAASRLERRRYEFYDPFADAGLDVFWEPRQVQSDQAGRIGGSGVLTWRRAGSLRYAGDAIVAQYRGEMAEGRAQGRGTFLDRSGLRYDGEWSDGLMEGQGHLLLPNGDVYRGGFKAGRLDGRGVYIDAAGRVYDGGFAAGLREGPAQVAEPDGRTYASVWVHGVEDALRRGPADEAWARLHRIEARSGPSDLAITVSVGGPPQFCCHPGPPAFGYASTSFTDRVEIFPDAPRLLDVWRGRANFVIANAPMFDWDRAQAGEYSLFNYNSNYNKTVSLQFGLENRGVRPAAIVGGYLDVSRSRVDMQPALQSLELTPRAGQSIAFSIENYGWSPARNARLTFRFQHGSARTDPQSIAIGEISGVQQFSFAPILEQFGVRVRQLAPLRNTCQSKPEGNQACLARLVRSGVFGRLADFVQSSGKAFGLRAVGQLDYEWRDADDRPQRTSAPFDAFIPIGTFESRAECEGGDFQDIASGQPFVLEENRQRYRIPFPLETSVGAGTIARWRIVLDAAKSSLHDMRVVLQMADGQEVVSRNISLLLFRPNSYPASIRPFEPRC